MMSVLRLIYVRPWEENQSANEADFVVTTSGDDTSGT